MKPKHVYLATLMAAGLFCAVAALQAQDAAPPAAKDDTKPAVQKKTLWEQIKEGGWVMFPIGACSILTLYLIGDGTLRTSPNRVLPPQHVQAVKDAFRHGDYVGAYNYCKANP